MIEIPITKDVDPAGLLHEILERTGAGGFADSSVLIIQNNPRNLDRGEFEAILAAHDPAAVMSPPTMEEQMDALFEGGPSLDAMRLRRAHWKTSP